MDVSSASPSLDYIVSDQRWNFWSQSLGQREWALECRDTQEGAFLPSTLDLQGHRIVYTPFSFPIRGSQVCQMSHLSPSTCKRCGSPGASEYRARFWPYCKVGETSNSFQGDLTLSRAINVWKGEQRRAKFSTKECLEGL